MVAITSPNPADSMSHGIPSIVRGDRTQPITMQETGPPQSQAPMTWQQEIVDTAVKAAMAGMRQLLSDSKSTEPSKHPGGGRNVLAIIAMVLGIMANIGVAAIVVGHELGNSAYEKAQAENNQAVRDELAAQRRAIYGLIDVLAITNPEVRVVERDLQR